jgi:hypothetical protein
MTETLTESFCERCGNRFTFESASPRVRLKSVKVLSRGLKNFVLSDDTSIDEAMAAARSETNREVTTHQLDAFHKTFNFCLSCRQYTCPDCWNENEARCLSCAPLVLPEAPAASDGFPVLGEATAPGEPAPGYDAADQGQATWPLLTAGPADVWSADPIVAAEAEVEPIVAAEAEVEPIVAAEAEVEPIVAAEAEVEPIVAAEAEVEPIVAAEAEVEPIVAAEAAAQTGGLLEHFRPGQNLDAELEAWERGQGDAEASGELAVEPTTPEAEPETVSAAQPEPPAAALAASPEPETIEIATPEPGAASIAEEPTAIEPVVVAPEPTIEPSPEPEPEPLAAATSADIVEQPTWQITAPDSAGTTPRTPPPEREAPVPVEPIVTLRELPIAEPQWPASPQWPGTTSGVGLPFPARPAALPGSTEALWAASAQELVTAPPAPGRATNAIRPCVSCGLSLSANARFCRRCGTLQGG